MQAVLRRPDIRRDNLKRLVAESPSATELARRAQTSPAYISQLLNHCKLPSGRPAGIGDKLAKKLEQGMNKPPGWLDFEHADNNVTHYPLLRYEQVLPYIRSELTDSEIAKAREDSPEYSSKLGNDCYAVKYTGSDIEKIKTGETLILHSPASLSIESSDSVKDILSAWWLWGSLYIGYYSRENTNASLHLTSSNDTALSFHVEEAIFAGIVRRRLFDY